MDDFGNLFSLAIDKDALVEKWYENSPSGIVWCPRMCRDLNDWEINDLSRLLDRISRRFGAFSSAVWGLSGFFRPLLSISFSVARHIFACLVDMSEVPWVKVKNNWFNRGGLTPLCIDHVLLEMYNSGAILQSGDLVDPTRGRLSQLFQRAVHLMGETRSKSSEGIHQILIIITEKAAEVVKLLSESHWTSFCIITMGKFQSVCKGSNEASVILGYLSECGKARYLSTSRKDTIEGVKVSLVTAAVPSISSHDCDVLHLIWTVENLQQQLDVIDQRYEMSRKSALAYLKFGNKKVALRHARQLKLASKSREKCSSLLNQVEEVISVISNAESTKKAMEEVLGSWDPLNDGQILILVTSDSLPKVDILRKVAKSLEIVAENINLVGMDSSIDVSILEVLIDLGFVWLWECECKGLPGRAGFALEESPSFSHGGSRLGLGLI
ncbi:hypothetical protein HHK36_023101 [Tetracentron sinense]|uniref:Uncharacterized protein n=1 Tax=Tetracentron sinense TaxID=13715 RepID=A0A834YW00_TETSI|nr:hypothetical protein HHK36_023101 [Tetracentron sinense]